MILTAPISTPPRSWRKVAIERGFSLRMLGDMLGRTHSTMLAYSCGKREMPQDLLIRLARLLGEPVQ